MKKNKLLVLLLTLVCLVSSSSSVFAATSAYFGSNSYCTVKISNKLMNNKRYKTATVKIQTLDMRNKKSSGVVNVKLTDGQGRYIGTYKKKSGDTIKLGNDHSSYRIYISEYNAPNKNNILDIFRQGNNFTNSGKCHKWKIYNNKECSIR